MDRKEQLRLAGIKRYGSEQAWRQMLSDSSNKARRDTPRGLTIVQQRDPQKFLEISAKGGRGGKGKPKKRNPISS